MSDGNDCWRLGGLLGFFHRLRMCTCYHVCQLHAP